MFPWWHQDLDFPHWSKHISESQDDCSTRREHVTYPKWEDIGTSVQYAESTPESFSSEDFCVYLNQNLYSYNIHSKKVGNDFFSCGEKGKMLKIRNGWVWFMCILPDSYSSYLILWKSSFDNY